MLMDIISPSIELMHLAADDSFSRFDLFFYPLAVGFVVFISIAPHLIQSLLVIIIASLEVVPIRV